KGCDVSGAQHSSTSPRRDSTALASAWRTRPECSAAAPSAPRIAARRVFTSPGTGAFANTATRTASGRGTLDVIAAREAMRVHAHGVREAQPPHEHDRAQHAMPLPAPRGSHHAIAQADRRGERAQALAERDVFHER